MKREKNRIVKEDTIHIYIIDKNQAKCSRLLFFKLVKFFKTWAGKWQFRQIFFWGFIPIMSYLKNSDTFLEKLVSDT